MALNMTNDEERLILQIRPTCNMVHLVAEHRGSPHGDVQGVADDAHAARGLLIKNGGVSAGRLLFVCPPEYEMSIRAALHGDRLMKAEMSAGLSLAELPGSAWYVAAESDGELLAVRIAASE